MRKKINPLTLSRTIKAKFKNAVTFIREDDQYITFHEDALLVEEKAGISARDGKHGKECRFSIYCVDLVLNALMKSGCRVVTVDPL